MYSRLEFNNVPSNGLISHIFYVNHMGNGHDEFCDDIHQKKILKM
jgi:hypothetical protein